MTHIARSLRFGLAAAFSVAASLSVAGVAQAQSPAECACLLPLASLPSTGPIGQVVSVSGNSVMLTGPAGPAPASAGAPLQSGDQLTVGPDSSVTFSVSNCSLQLPAQTQMTLAPVEGNMCVAVNEAGAPTLAGGNAAIIAGGVLGVASVTAVVLSTGTSSPVSP